VQKLSLVKANSFSINIFGSLILNTQKEINKTQTIASTIIAAVEKALCCCGTKTTFGLHKGRRSDKRLISCTLNSAASLQAYYEQINGIKSALKRNDKGVAELFA
jgi:hypothetical protein